MTPHETGSTATPGTPRATAPPARTFGPQGPTLGDLSDAYLQDYQVRQFRSQSTARGADVAGSETPGISTRCSSRSRVASNTCGAPWMRTVTSSTSSCNRDGIGTPRCASFASY